MRHRRTAFLLALLFAFALLCALSPSSLLASGGEEGPAMTMNEILWDLGIKVLNVSILGFFAFKYLSAPLNRLVEMRSEKVRRELEDSVAARRDAEERLRQFKEKVAKIDVELEALRKQTCDDIDKEQKILLGEAREAAGHIRRHAQDTIRQELSKARAELHRDAVRLAADLSEQLIRKSIGSDDHRRLATEYIQEMEAKK